ncbi:thymidylate synthase family protein [Leptospira interrogans]|uniref:thymidylate synthase n=1 Tax=Leptospira interrogans TaxID=173 RepID=UPI0017863D29|nr:thymidylate synthase [Leptospira interrogans]MBE0305415.1 thymidylate synthase [Leptospira interrogans serovar Yeoncheon]
MDPKPILISESNLSLAWVNAIRYLKAKPKEREQPLVVSFQGVSVGEVEEDENIRDCLDNNLKEKNSLTVNQVSYTIFPNDLWTFSLRNSKSREEFFSDYINRILPKMKKRDKRNMYGTYFQRMIQYNGASHDSIKSVDQLSHVINMLTKKKHSRASSLQITIFDPAKDHTNQPVRGFPCLQQIGLSYSKDALVINAFYPTQYMIEKAYGNYLGLAQLGQFISHETGLSVKGINVFITNPKLQMPMPKSFWDAINKITNTINEI